MAIKKYRIIETGAVVVQYELGKYFPNTAFDWSQPLPAALVEFLGIEEYVQPPPPPPSLQERKNDLYNEITRKRQSVMADGFSYTFPDGITAVIQIRDDKNDVANITGVSTAALVLKMSGSTDVFTQFIDSDNKAHSLTPDEAIAMGMQVMAYVGKQYQVKTTKYEQVDLASTIEDLDAIDIDSGWGVQ